MPTLFTVTQPNAQSIEAGAAIVDSILLASDSGDRIIDPASAHCDEARVVTDTNQHGINASCIIIASCHGSIVAADDCIGTAALRSQAAASAIDSERAAINAPIHSICTNEHATETTVGAFDNRRCFLVASRGTIVHAANVNVISTAHVVASTATHCMIPAFINRDSTVPQAIQCL